MNIGSVTMTDQGQLLGSVAIMNFDARIGFKPVASTNPRAPKFEIVALNIARRWVRIGALWEKEARETGEVYLNGNIDDPSLPSKLYIAVFRQQDGSYSIAWNRSDPTAKGVDSRGASAPAFDEIDGPPADYDTREYTPQVEDLDNRDYAPAVEAEAPEGGRRRKRAEAEKDLAEHPFD